MITFRSLVRAELERCLARRAVHVLIAVAVAGTAVTGVAGYLVTDADETRTTTNTTLARLGDLWTTGGDATMAPAFILLLIGALIGGALITGGEWRAGTVVTLSTWEVRRARLLWARLAACAILAPVIGLALVGLFVVAILPTVLAKGTTDGVDVAWGLAFAAAIGRVLVLIALTAVLGAAVANIGRSTTAALAALFVYNVVVEPTVRTVWPRRAEWLLGENLSAWVTGIPVEGTGFERGVAAGGATLAAYVTVVAVTSVIAFSRRDLQVAG